MLNLQFSDGVLHLGFESARVTKQQFGFTKARYRGLAKTPARLTALFAMNNLWKVRKGSYQRTPMPCRA
jgi:IS5 family transposase